MIIGHEKGDDTASRLRHNFGMAKPEGYRKAIRLMQLADRFGIPIVTLVDTPGAFPGVEAEERGQAEAIARSTEQCLEVRVPVIAAVVGEGGSGGAVAIAVFGALVADLAKAKQMIELEPDAEMRELAKEEARELELAKDLGRYGKTRVNLVAALFEDFVDIIPIGLTGESPGNIDKARAYAIDWNSTFQLDPLGVKGARINLRALAQFSSLRDPQLLLNGA